MIFAGTNGLIVDTPGQHPLGDLAAFGRLGVLINSASREPHPLGMFGFGDDSSDSSDSSDAPAFDINNLVSSVAGSLPGLINAGTGIAKTLTGAQVTGSSGLPANKPLVTPPSALSKIPTVVWVLGGVAVLGGIAVLMMKK